MLAFSPYLTLWLATALPPSESNATVYVSATQDAVSFKLPFTGALKSYAADPFIHLSNLCPALVGADGIVALSPSFTVWLATALPPLLSNTTVCFVGSIAFGVHFA